MVLILLVFALITGAPHSQWTLADGSTLRFQHASFGSSHERINLKKGLRWLEGRISHRLAARLHIMNGGLSSTRSTNELGVFTFREGQAMSGRLSMAVLDDRGAVFALNQSGSCSSREWVQSLWLTEVFPRRQKTLKVQTFLRQPDGQQTAGPIFTIPNPVSRKFSVWTATRPPMRQQQERLTVELLRVTTGFFAGIQTQADLPDDLTATRLELRMSEHDGPTDRWRLVCVELSDATGNRFRTLPWKTNYLAVARRGEDLIVTIAGALPFDEAAWKVRLELVPTSGWNSADLTEVGPVPVPLSGLLTTLQFSVALHQTNYTLDVCLRSRHAQPTGSGQPFRWLPSDGVHEDLFLATTTPIESRRLLLLAVQDANGRMIGPDDARLADAWPVKLDVPPDARQLRLKVAFPQSRFVEFLAKPEVADPEERRLDSP